MIVICEECGRKYRIDPAKIQGRAASFKCRQCAHLIMVRKPGEFPSRPDAGAYGRNSDTVAGSSDPSAEASGAEDVGKSALGSPAAMVSRRRSGFGLRARMMILFALIPLLLIAAAGAAYLWQMETLTNNLTRQSSQIVNQLAEGKIADLSKAVAVQCQLYLAAHPQLTKYNFDTDPGFKTVAVQPVGKTGYTALYELPGPAKIWRTWAHDNPNIIGADMEKLLKKPLGKNFPGFWKIFTGIEGRNESRGYYTWQDKDKRFRDKFMVCTPVQGTRFVIAATTYMDEFTLPMQNLEAKARELNEKSRYIAIGIVATTLLLILLVVAVYGHRLSGRIRSLTDVAERISVGDLDIEIESTSRDEIGELAEAISRMQESIRLSIERLRRRR
jgi:predicted Zn finger-like uncharacterized protein